MRKITQEAAKAFNNREDFHKDNTTVYNTLSSVTLQLHNNDIACIDNAKGGKLLFTMSGLTNLTTRERLKGIGIIIYQKNFRQFLIVDWAAKEIDPYKWYDAKWNNV